MSILIINPPVREHEAPQHFPSGLGYITQVIKNEGYDVKVLDINGLRISRDEVLEYIKKTNAKFFLTGGLITVYKYIKWLAEEIKRYHPDSWMIAGNSLASSAPETILKNTKVDILVIGEGEITILELLDKLSNNVKLNELKEVKGIAYKSKDEIIMTPPRQVIHNLNTLPFPAWDLFPMDMYLNSPVLMDRLQDRSEKSINISTRRSCPYRCTYCYHVMGYQSRLRNVESVIKELEYLKKRYNIKIVAFTDDLFTSNREWVMNFCDELIKRKLNLSWGTTARVNTVDEEMLKKMRLAGCEVLSYGIESGSQRMLDIMKKGVTVEQASRAIRLTRKVGIHVSTSFMIGFPEETKEDLEETIKFCINNDIHLISIFFVTPYPGTALYEQVKKIGLIKNEEEFISKLGDATELTINLTKLSDYELKELREHVIHKVRKAYFKKHRAEYARWLFKKQRWYLKHIRTYGLNSFLQEARKKLVAMSVR